MGGECRKQVGEKRTSRGKIPEAYIPTQEAPRGQRQIEGGQRKGVHEDLDYDILRHANLVKQRH